jgi:ABC-type methionine transport system ATPase subunit
MRQAYSDDRALSLVIVPYLNSPGTRQYVPVVASGSRAGDQAHQPGELRTPAAEVVLTGVVLRGEEPASKLRAAAGISLAVSAGESVALYGRDDGTAVDVLDVVAGLRRPRRGEVVVGGVAVDRLTGPAMERYRGERGLVSPRFPLLPSLPVIDNVLVALWSQRARSAARARAAELLAVTGVADFASREVDALSAEQQWRVLIARALLPAPRLMLAEDPSSALHPRSAAHVLDVLMDAHARFGFTLLLATDRLATAAACQRLLGLADGTVIQDETAGDDAWTRGRVDRIG